jgi:hypothetical protein
VTGLTLVASAVGTDQAPPVSGFIESPFNPLVYQVASRCLTARPVDGERTGVILASFTGDSVTTDLAAELLHGGQKHNPLLFMQATANAILGYLSKEFDLTGPLLSMSTSDSAGSGPWALAGLLLADGDLDHVLVIGVELAGTARTDAVHRALGTTAPPHDLAVGLLVTPGDGEFPDGAGITGLLALAGPPTTTATATPGRTEGGTP